MRPPRGHPGLRPLDATSPDSPEEEDEEEEEEEKEKEEECLHSRSKTRLQTNQGKGESKHCGVLPPRSCSRSITIFFGSSYIHPPRAESSKLLHSGFASGETSALPKKSLSGQGSGAPSQVDAGEDEQVEVPWVRAGERPYFATSEEVRAAAQQDHRIGEILQALTSCNETHMSPTSRPQRGELKSPRPVVRTCKQWQTSLNHSCNFRDSACSAASTTVDPNEEALLDPFHVSSVFAWEDNAVDDEATSESLSSCTNHCSRMVGLGSSNRSKASTDTREMSRASKPNMPRERCTLQTPRDTESRQEREIAGAVGRRGCVQRSRRPCLTVGL